MAPKKKRDGLVLTFLERGKHYPCSFVPRKKGSARDAVPPVSRAAVVLLVQLGRRLAQRASLFSFHSFSPGSWHALAGWKKGGAGLPAPSRKTNVGVTT